MLFFELIQVALGTRDKLSKIPSEEEWQEIYQLAVKQSLVGLTFSAIEQLNAADAFIKPPMSLFYEWLGEVTRIENQNGRQRSAATQLVGIFKEGNLRSCVLKGQGTAQLYKKPLRRQPGDIDLWVEGERDEIISYIHSLNVNINKTDIKHADTCFFKDVPVEIHFLPSWMYCPITNYRLQKFFKQKSDVQFGNTDSLLGFTHTTVDFDLIFSLVHIYRHVFDEGVGLRQLLDYFHILKASTNEQRENAIIILKQLKMQSFAGGVMWILEEIFGMSNTYSLCTANSKHGKFLLSEILIAGNFGHYDKRINHTKGNNRLMSGVFQLKRNIRFLTYYPSEVLWSPIWKVWHWCWRKRKGYI